MTGSGNLLFLVLLAGTLSAQPSAVVKATMDKKLTAQLEAALAGFHGQVCEKFWF